MKTINLLFFIAVYLTMCHAPAFAGDSAYLRDSTYLSSPQALETNLSVSGSLSVGTVIIWPSNKYPRGWSSDLANTDWLECNGQLIPSQYNRLIAIVGGRTPDYTGRFLRGMGGKAENIFNKVQNSSVNLNDSFKSQIKLKNVEKGVHTKTTVSVVARGNHGGDSWHEISYHVTPLRFQATSSEEASTIGIGGGTYTTPIKIHSEANETRPDNMAVKYFIKTR